MTDIKPPYRLVAALGLSCSVSIGLLVARVIASDSQRYTFLIWNLALAAVPLLLGWWLVQRIEEYGWFKWQQVILTAAWLSFLPNSFYIITDFIHLRETYEASLMFDVVLLLSFALNGLILGFISLYLVHAQLIKRFHPKTAYLVVAIILLACSFAAYLGRYTRWNSWDVLLRPAGLLFDVSDRFINPAAHQETYLVTLLMFGLLMSLYAVIWESARLLRQK